MKEGGQVSTRELALSWEEVLAFYDNLIDRQNFKLRPVRLLVRYIIEAGFSEYFYAGTSLYSLLISLPTMGRINFKKTLRVSYNQLKQTVTFEYWDCDRNQHNRDNKRWSVECQVTEVIDTFESFLMENEGWKPIQNHHRHIKPK